MREERREIRARIFAALVSLLCLLSLTQLCIAQPTPATTNPTTDDDLRPIIEHELGTLVTDQNRDKLLAAHKLIEEFFDSPLTRKDTLAALELFNLDPNLLGRITRIRSSWPALAPGVYYINERVGPSDAVYFLGIPKGYDRAKAWPLVIKLPTASAFVSNPAPTPERVSEIYTNWVNTELTAHPDAVVLMPLLNMDEQYGPMPQGMNRVTVPMQHAASLVNIDPAKVYMVGYSMSAFAVWNIALHEPTYFAAFDALAGNAAADWQRLRLMDLRNTLPVIWNDADDQIVRVAGVRTMVAALRRLKCDVEYNETKSAGHTPGPEIVEAAYGKMRARTRELYPKQVSLQSNRIEPVFNRADWVRIDEPDRPGNDHHLILRDGGGSLTMYENTFKVDATITKPNRIEVIIDNVNSFRLLLNDQMIDFTQPVTVLVNGKQRFSGIVKPNDGEMLADQLTLGRGWRYFTAHVDIDFSAPTTKPTSRPR